MNGLDLLPSDAHRAMLAYLRQNARGRIRSIPRDVVRQAIYDQYKIELVDRDMRQIRGELVAWGYPCFPGPGGYYYGVDTWDLADAQSYLRKKIMPMLKERKDMRYAFDAEGRRQRFEGQTQMDLPMRVPFPMGAQTVKWPR